MKSSEISWCTSIVVWVVTSDDVQRLFQSSHPHTKQRVTRIQRLTKHGRCYQSDLNILRVSVTHNAGHVSLTLVPGVLYTAAEQKRTNVPTGRTVDRVRRAGSSTVLRFLLVGELAQVPHCPEKITSTGGWLSLYLI